MRHPLVKSFVVSFSLASFSLMPLMASSIELTQTQMKNVSLDYAIVSSRQSTSTLTVQGTLRADQQRLFRVTPVVDGLVTELKVVEQTMVHKGQVLANLRSSSLGRSQTDYLEALSRYNVAEASYLRIKGLRKDGVVSASRMLTTESEFKTADAILDQRHRELTLAGMTTAQIENLHNHPDSIADYALYSPTDGMMLDVNIESGQMLNAGESAFRIIDLTVVWADVRIPAAHIGDVALNTDATISVTAYPQQKFIGRLKTLSGEVDVNSQTLSGRVIIDNKKGLLRPGMYVQAELQGMSRSGLMVPASAVFRRGNDNYVFTVTNDNSGTNSKTKNFKPIKINASVPSGGWIHITSNKINTTTKVVTKGVAELKSHWQYSGESIDQSNVGE